MKKWIFWLAVAAALIVWVNKDPGSFGSTINIIAAGIGTILWSVIEVVTKFVIVLIAGPQGDGTPVLAIAVVAVIIMMIMALKRKLFG